MSSMWRVYIVLCSDGTLYTGITTDLCRRVAAHNSAKGGARYTKYRRPVRLVYTEPVTSRTIAARREWQIKQMASGDKWSLISERSVAKVNTKRKLSPIEATLAVRSDP